MRTDYSQQHRYEDLRLALNKKIDDLPDEFRNQGAPESQLLRIYKPVDGPFALAGELSDYLASHARLALLAFCVDN